VGAEPPVAVLRLLKPSTARLDRALAEATAAEFTYAEVGATRTADWPAGYQVDRYERSLGTADGRFERAVACLKHWQAQAGAGIHIHPVGAIAQTGAPVLFVARALGLWAVLPCRVVYTVESPSWFAFAYGTLPGHLERGEVAMSVERSDGGEVVARIVSFSKTVHPLARASGPLGRRIQTQFTNGYLDALERATG
jgi:uncharacterized protein (UPF0548 family)